jgi:hypothetical protein
MAADSESVAFLMSMMGDACDEAIVCVNFFHDDTCSKLTLYGRQKALHECGGNTEASALFLSALCDESNAPQYLPTTEGSRMASRQSGFWRWQWCAARSNSSRTGNVTHGSRRPASCASEQRSGRRCCGSRSQITCLPRVSLLG